jgi:hypothetical protein
MGTGKNLNFFGKFSIEKSNLLIRDSLYMNALNMVLMCGKFWSIGKEKKRGAVTLTKYFFLQ